MERESGEEIGTITYLYDHKQRGLGDELTEVQHHYLGMIKSSTHIHLDRENCFEIVAIQGDAKKIKELTENIMSLKGVKHVKLTTTHGGI
jgi:CopG family nickel-responsive transcriptional regulator